MHDVASESASGAEGCAETMSANVLKLCSNKAITETY